jgi:hypothetical protein
MTRSSILHLKKPASIICEAEGDDRYGQCKKVLFRICLRLSTSINLLGEDLITVVSVFAFFNNGPAASNAGGIGRGLFVVRIMIIEEGDIDKTNGHEGLRCLCIANGFMSDFKPDTSSPHVGQRATSPLSVYSNPAEHIA